MTTVELDQDLERTLQSAAQDVGDALSVRRRVASDTRIQSSLRGLVDRDEPAEALSPEEAARRATALFLMGRDDRIAPYAQRSESYRIRHLWALAETYRDNLQTAADVLKSCLESEARDERVRLQLAALQSGQGDTEAARETLGDLAGQTDRSEVLFVLGSVAQGEGDYEQAREHYEAALGHDPDNVDALFRLAFLYDSRGDDDAALALYERARRLKPTRVNVLINLGVLYEDRSEFGQAADCYRQILAQFPDHARARAFLRDAESSLSMVLDEDMERKEDRRNQLLRTPISDFELSVRSRNCLAKMNIQSLGDLIQRTEAELLAYKNFGETSLSEIKSILTSKGLRLGMRRDEIPVAGLDAMPMLPDVPGSDPAALRTPIDELVLSVRSRKVVENLGIQTVGDLLQHTENELLNMPNFGATSLQEIKAKLTDLGVTLRKS